MKHSSTSQPALKVTSSADGFGGTVARIEAPGKKGAGGFKLLEGEHVIEPAQMISNAFTLLRTMLITRLNYDAQVLLPMKRFFHCQMKGIYL